MASSAHKFIAHSATTTPANPNDWIIDSACNAFLTPIKDRITQYQELAKPEEVIGLGGKRCNAVGKGNLTLEDQQGKKFTLKNVLYVPDAESSLISFILAREHGLFVEFTSIHNFNFTAPASGLQLSGTSIDRILHVKDFGAVSKYSLSAINRISNDALQASQYPTSPSPSSLEPQSAVHKNYVTASQSLKDHRITRSPQRHPPLRAESSHLWHLRLGHSSLRSIQKIPFLTHLDE